MVKKLLYKAWRSLAALLLLGLLTASPIVAQTTAFTYQGKLTDAGNPANGTFDLQFKLFDTAALGTGTQQGATLTNPTVQVTAGSFSVQLDFGATVFDGSARFLEIGVRPAGSANPYTVLSPRQAINSAPYAVNARQLGGLAATRYVATDANGNVGIGTATPSTKLEVVDPVRQLRFGPTAADNGGYLISTNPSQAIIIGGARWDSTANWIARASLASMTAHQNGAIEFYANDGLIEGNPFSPTLRMAIYSNGRVAIGTASPSAKLHVIGGGGLGVLGESTDAFGVYGYSTNSYGVFGESATTYAGYFLGDVFVTGIVHAGGYTTPSDARLKQNITALGYGLSEVLRLRPVSWRWKAHPESGEQLGLVAQEVESVIPELVSTAKDAEQMKGLNYVGLLPVLVNAIKEQQTQIQKQAHEIRRLQQLVCLDHPKATICRKAH